MKDLSLWQRASRAVKFYSSYYLRRKEPILVYTSGRVGSMSLGGSLRDHDALAINVHLLSRVKNSPWLLRSGSEFWVYHNLIKRGIPLKIIFVARDPVAMMVTEYFSKLKWMTGERDAALTSDMDVLIDRFNRQYFEENRHWRLLNWFDTEVNATIGLDVYRHPSPAEHGYVRFNAGRFDVLSYRLEIDDDLKSHIVREFVGMPEFKILRQNVSENKRYGENYKSFKEQVRIPKQRLDEIYDSRYSSHFYSEAERESMRRRWGG